jgi:phosphoribosylaminoimidazole carboxylase PurE protein
MARPPIGIIYGSKSDRKVMRECRRVLTHFGVNAEEMVASSHRSPAKVREYAVSARERGVKVIIAGAGMAAHLAGTIASETTLPVIGVPLDASLGGLDSLLSTVQMPSGVPVAAVSVGKAGARNAALLAIEIISLEDEKLEKKLVRFREKLKKSSWDEMGF